MDVSIRELVKDTSRLYIERAEFDIYWIKYPDDEDDDDWFITRCCSQEDAEFVLDALTLHCNNFLE